MAEFFDQDNPYASQRRSVTSRDDTIRRMVENSTGPNITTERVHIRRVKSQKQVLRKRLTTFFVAAALVGGLTSNMVSLAVDRVKDNMIVSDQTLEFKTEVIAPNTHRTDDNQHYFYDYDDIAAWCMGGGKDFSTELYLAYANLGENQTNKVMDFTPYGDLGTYVSGRGFESVDEWAKNERKKIVLMAEVDAKQSELAAMSNDLNRQQVENAVKEAYDASADVTGFGGAK